MPQRLVLFCLAAIFLAALLRPAFAEHAIAMHGVPKYPENFAHLDYVNPEAPKGGTLSMAKTGSFDSLNGHIVNGTAAEGLELISDRLMARVWDEPFSLYGLVAQSIDIAPDRSWVVFHLNPRARFHDGRAMTAEDVKFSFDFYRKSGHPVRRRVYGLVTDVKIIDPQTIRFQFGPGYDRESVMILAIMPVLPKHDWEKRDPAKTTLDIPLGSGPYKIAKVDPGRRIEYARVDDYWAKDLPINRGLYNFDRIDYLYFRDDDVALQAFLSGEFNYRKETDIAKWQSRYDDKAATYVRNELPHQRPEWLRAFIFNTRREMFSDQRVRKAVSLMFNDAWMNKNFYDGQMKRIESLFPNSELAAPVPAREFMDERAKRRMAMDLLKQAGWQFDGKNWSKSGQPLAFEILLSSPIEEKIALEFARQLKKSGIVMTVRTVDSAQFTGRLDDFDYDMVSFRWVNSLSPGNEQLNYWGSAAARLNGSRNYAGVDDPVIDAAANAIAAANDRQGLVQACHVLDRLIMQRDYFVPLFYLGKDMIAHSPDIAAPQKTPIYGIVIESLWHKNGQGGGLTN
jgi:ABC-type oligopeptide transport system substrate-binding subunit